MSTNLGLNNGRTLLEESAVSGFKNFVSTPGTVGRKKGAFSGTFGGSLGLFLSCKSLNTGINNTVENTHDSKKVY